MFDRDVLENRSYISDLFSSFHFKDFLTGIIHCLPSTIARLIGFQYGEVTWLAGDFTCKLFWVIGHAPVMTSNYVLACTSVDRALAVCRPMNRINQRGEFFLSETFIRQQDFGLVQIESIGRPHFIVDQMVQFFLERVENIVEKEKMLLTIFGQIFGECYW